MNNGLPSTEPVTASNRIAGSGIMLLGLLLVLLAIYSLGAIPTAMGRYMALATAVSAIILLAIGGVIGFRDFLPRGMTANTLIGFGLITVVCGAAIAAWIAYNLLVERQVEFRIRRVTLPLVMIGVGVGLFKKGYGLRRELPASSES